jgi:polar amino acid transport system substrate-binding protein
VNKIAAMQTSSMKQAAPPAPGLRIGQNGPPSRDPAMIDPPAICLAAARQPPAWRTGAALVLLAMPALAQAGCSRPIHAPMAPIGRSVFAGPDGPGGVYPEILRSVEAREGCSFVLSIVPKARQEAMFENGKADLLIPAVRTARRDQLGVFVPLTFNRATLISLASERPALASMQELLARRELRVALVRGFDYGEAYQQLARELERQGRLVQEVDPNGVARLLKAGMADATVMAPSILLGAIHGDARVQQLSDKLRYEPLAELPWGDSGAYISRRSVSSADQAALRDLLERLLRSGTLWKSFQQHYPPGSLADSVKPR